MVQISVWSIGSTANLKEGGSSARVVHLVASGSGSVKSHAAYMRVEVSNGNSQEDKSTAPPPRWSSLSTIFHLWIGEQQWSQWCSQNLPCLSRVTNKRLFMQNMFSPISNKITLLHNLLSQYPPLESCTVPTTHPIANTPVPFLPPLFHSYHRCSIPTTAVPSCSISTNPSSIPTTPVPSLPPLSHPYHPVPSVPPLSHPYHHCPTPTTPVAPLPMLFHPYHLVPSLPPLFDPYHHSPTPTTPVAPLPMLFHPYHLVPSRPPIPSQPLPHLTCEDRYSGCFPSSIVSQQSSDLSLEHVQV